MNNEILDSLRRISCGMEIVMRWELEEIIGKGGRK